MKKSHRILACTLALALGTTPAHSEQVLFSTKATNELGIDLYRILAKEEGNLCLSPYSIQSAFAMTANGADGKTLAEMQAILHYPPNSSHLNASFLALAGEYEKRQADAEKAAKQSGDGKREPNFQLLVANRLFGQKGYPFEPAFLDTVKTSYKAPLQFADFKGNADGERTIINKWVEEQTRDRIANLLPEKALNPLTRLVLVNALYFKAAWQNSFQDSATKPAAFHLDTDKLIETPTMRTTKRFGYRKEEGYTAVTLPYSRGFEMLVVVPDQADGLLDLAESLSADQLFLLAQLPNRMVSLHLPKFKIEGAAISLKDSLAKLGLKLPFHPRLADFGRMTSDKTLPGLFIDDAYHKTFIAVDEKGTEAAAATAIVMAQDPSSPLPEKPVEVRVDRPFFYAIMDTRSRTALFLGCVKDPR